MYNQAMKTLDSVIARVTLALGLLATLIAIVTEHYWALPICAVLVIADMAAMAPDLWLPRIRRWWMNKRK